MDVGVVVGVGAGCGVDVAVGTGAGVGVATTTTIFGSPQAARKSAKAASEAVRNIRIFTNV